MAEKISKASEIEKVLLKAVECVKGGTTAVIDAVVVPGCQESAQLVIEYGYGDWEEGFLMGYRLTWDSEVVDQICVHDSKGVY